MVLSNNFCMHKFLCTLTEKRVIICVFQSLFSYGVETTPQQPRTFGSKVNALYWVVNEWSPDHYLTANWSVPLHFSWFVFVDRMWEYTSDHIWALVCKQSSIFSMRSMQSSCSIHGWIWMALVMRTWLQFVNNLEKILVHTCFIIIKKGGSHAAKN